MNLPLCKNTSASDEKAGISAATSSGVLHVTFSTSGAALASKSAHAPDVEFEPHPVSTT